MGMPMMGSPWAVARSKRDQSLLIVLWTLEYAWSTLDKAGLCVIKFIIISLKRYGELGEIKQDPLFGTKGHQTDFQKLIKAVENSLL